MSKLDILDVKGAKLGEFSVDESLLVLDRGEQAVHDVVTADLAGRRRGTASTLTKGEVAGSNRKPWRQKGTGRARAGYRQSPVWRGGSVVFGPRPRRHRGKVNRKIAGLAFRRAFSEKLAAGEVKVIEELTLENARTASFAAVLKSLEIDGAVLFAVSRIERDVTLASRNIPGVKVVKAADLGVYDLLRHPVVVATRAAMELITDRMRPDGGSAGKAETGK
jgi:large subunit ribosomal protein L4